MTRTLATICTVLLVLAVRPSWAQEPKYLDEPVKDMVYKSNVIKSADFEEGDDYTTLENTQTYVLTPLDNRQTAKAIVRERTKGVIVDDIVALLRDQAEKERAQSVKSGDRSSAELYKLVTDKRIADLLPSIVRIEQTGEEWGQNGLTLKAKATASPTTIAAAVKLIHKKQAVFDEITGMRAMADAAMADLLTLQKGRADSRPYLAASRRLMAADHYERARYLEINNRLDDAIAAYTDAVAAEPELAVAYRNRGRLHLNHLKDRAKAASDFDAAIKAFVANAAGHMKSRKFKNCIEDVAAALKLSPNYGRAYFQRAACRIGLRDQDGGKADFIRAAQLGDKAAQDLLAAKGISWQ